MGSLSVAMSNHVFLGQGSPDVRAALVIEGDTIRAVASPEHLAHVVPEGVPVRDFGDAFICPGFHDAHQHVFHTSLFRSDLALSYAGTSEKDCVRRLREFAADHPGDGWLLGQGFRSALWDPPVPPTRASLDEAFPDRPVCMYEGDLHTLWVNTRGLRELGITDDTVPPAGGFFDRDEDGHLTGVIHEAAGMYYVSKVFASLPRQGVLDAYRDYFRMSLSQGITSVCDMALCAIPGTDFVYDDIYRELLDAGQVPMRVHLYPQNVGTFERVESLQAEFRGKMVRVPGTKQFFDGISSAHTAWLHEPYANPYFPGDCGRPTVDAEVMRSYVMEAARRGIATRIHTIGDRAVSTAIDIFAEARRTYGRPRQGMNAIEHIENLTPADVEAMARIDLVASVQPQHVVIDVTQPERDLGPERASFMWPFASYARAGVTMAFGTDSPCVPDSAMQVLSCAVTREVPQTNQPSGGWLPQERISMPRAIDAYTRGSARLVGREHELGTLAAGKLADFVVLDTDLVTADPERIQDVATVATYVGGVPVWEA
ncbi:amidohydrolase family protein [Olsenella umbonata]|uniref:Amidohydrolase family protein n=1 Tax=Parafannyhessea umbonata TaxID=604330 RepID=A0A7X9T9Y2_9ACTN|nr:amidohydrolase [Parafannyhessea umbonata]NMF25565.1 amidohydrolase family protein [Parafannyhessea umbonata]